MPPYAVFAHESLHSDSRGCIELVSTGMVSKSNVAANEMQVKR
jgi:hypothetical protein